MKNTLKGFTLVEVLIVVIIIGILIAALLPRLTGTQARARDTARQANIQQIAQGVALARADNPTLIFTGCADDNEAHIGLVTSGYLVSLPSDPSGFGTGGTCTSEGQYALLGGAGDITVIAQSERDVGNCDKTTGVFNTSNDGNGFCIEIQ